MTTDKTKRFFRVSTEDFKKIPGSPIAYWIGKKLSNAFNYQKLISFADARVGMATGRNDYYLRTWYEISQKNIGFLLSRQEAKQSNFKWFPYNKGGEFRRWYGNRDYVVNWRNDGNELQTTLHPTDNRIWAHNFILDRIFRPGISWTVVSSGKQAFRYSPKGCLFDAAAGVCQAKSDSAEENQILLLFLNSNVAELILKILNPTINLHPGYIESLPFIPQSDFALAGQLLKLSQSDWDSYETSWDFQENPLIQEAKSTAKPSKAGEGLLSSHAENGEYLEASRPLADIYVSLRLKWRQQTEEMRRLETENNRIFIDAYGLRDELSPEVPWNEITLTCNPWYRYGKTPENTDLLGNSFYLNHLTAQIKPTSKQEEDFPAGDFPFAHETEQRLLEDTIKEFISYAVGCMMGRYSPEKPGLILANQGDGFVRYHEIMSGQDSDEMMLISNATKAELRSAAGETLADDEAYRKKRQNRHPMLSSYQIRDCISSRYHVICDRDGVIPILDDEWFVDDIVAQFKDFLKFTFGEEAFSRNLAFIEKAIGKDIRKYFMKDFYKEHVQRYKKRPIYWLFSSPKGSFNALIYLHRYRPDTVSIVLNDYLREFMTKLRVQRSHLIDDNNRADLSASEKSANLKRIDKYAAMLAELEDYERDILFPLAQKQLAIDLDDGVKVNYLRFGAALKEIPGLKAREE